MTYQSPYQPPSGYSNFDYSQPDLLAPARRASLMMFILGGLALLSSFCCAGAGAMVPQLMQQPDFAQRMQNVPGATPTLLRAVFIFMGVLSLAAAIAMVILGVFVRRGGKGSIVTSIVLCVLTMFLMLVYLVGAVLQGGQEVIGGVCMAIVPIVLLVVLIVMLVAALQAADKVAAHRYSVQYWQHAQQQAYAQQAGYGYLPPPPQEQPPLPPPTSPPNPPEPPAQA